MEQPGELCPMLVYHLVCVHQCPIIRWHEALFLLNPALGKVGFSSFLKVKL